MIHRVSTSYTQQNKHGQITTTSPSPLSNSTSLNGLKYFATTSRILYFNCCRYYWSDCSDGRHASPKRATRLAAPLRWGLSWDVAGTKLGRTCDTDGTYLGLRWDTDETQLRLSWDTLHKTTLNSSPKRPHFHLA